MSLNGLEKITEKILSDANARAEQILAAANAECERITKEKQEAAEQIRERQAAAAEREGMEEVARAKANAVSYRRNLLLVTQSELVNGVYEGALAGTRALQPEAYTDLLIGLLTAAMLEQIETENTSRELADEEGFCEAETYELLLNARDRERFGAAVLDAAKKKLTGKLPQEKLDRMCLGERPVAIDAGLVLRAGAVEANCSLESLFALLREETEGEVSRALFESRGKA